MPENGTTQTVFTCTAIAGGCGNDTLEANEECDDGNTVNGDGCSDQCKKERYYCIWDYSANAGRGCHREKFCTQWVGPGCSVTISGGSTVLSPADTPLVGTSQHGGFLERP